MLEAYGRRQKHGAKARQVRHFVPGDQGHHLAANAGIVVGLPQTAGLDERVGHPDVGIGGGVGIDRLPLAVFVPSPQPGRQVGLEIAAGQITWVHFSTRSKVARSLAASEKNIA